MRALLTVALLVGMSVPAFAQDDNLEFHESQASGLVNMAKVVVDTLDPSIDSLYVIKNGSITDGELVYGLSGSVWKFTSDEIELGQARIGYIPQSEHRVYAGLQADGKGWIKRWASNDVKEVFTSGFLGTFTEAFDKYGRLGIFGGYDFEYDAFIWGPSLGARIAF